MTLDLKNSTANYMLDQLYDNKFPAGSLLQFRSGAPAGAENAAGGTLGAEVTTPATPFNAAASGSKTKNGTWSVAATAAITIGHFRLKNAGDTEREEGTVTATGGGGDLTVDNTSLASAQVVTVNTYSHTG